MKYSSNDVVTPEPKVVPGPTVPLNAEVSSKKPEEKPAEQPKSKKKMLLLLLLLLLFFLLGVGLMFMLLQTGVIDLDGKKSTDKTEETQDEGDEDTDIDAEKPDEKVGEEANEIVLSETYTNTDYPKLSINYPEDWKLTTKNVDRPEETYDDLEVTLTKNSVDLVFYMKPVTGIGGLPTCYKYDEIDYTKINDEWVRASQVKGEEVNVIIYHKGLLDRDKSASDFESEAKGFLEMNSLPASDIDDYEACATLIEIAATTPTTYKLDSYEIGALVEIKLSPESKVTAELAKEADAIVLGMVY